MWAPQHSWGITQMNLKHVARTGVLMISKRRKFIVRFLAVLLFVLTITSGFYYLAYKRILERAEQNVENVILSQRGLHHYIHVIMHPEFFRAIDSGKIVKDYYSPVIFSSSYIVRNMHGLYNQELVKHGHPEIYYKLAADNPRNPVNKADQLEAELIRKFNADRALQRYREVVTINGKKYIYVAIPYKENQKTCLRCHGKRADAPLGLQALYLGEGGFNEKEGQIRAIESIRAPLDSEYQAMHTVLAAVVATALAILGLYWFNSRLRSEVENKTESLQTELQKRQETEMMLQEQLSARIEAENELRSQTDLLEQEIAERQKTQEELTVAKEMAEAANKAKTQFLANMSHELRTPLNGVFGMAQLIAMTGVTEEQQEYLNTLQFSAGNLVTLINDILDITRIEAGEFKIQQSEYSLSHCIYEVIATQQSAISAKGLSIQTIIPETVPDLLMGDRLRVMQVLSNLLSNAIKFTETGGVRFDIAIKEQHDSVILLDIAVTDTGIGIEPSMLGYIFNMFSQADESNTRRHGGAGLGLAICRKLSELMGGSITVESKPGKGSTFHLTIPCTVPSRPNQARDENLISVVTESLEDQKRTVLIAEDNPANSSYAQKLMEKFGYRTVLAGNGNEALKAWQQQPFDLILMDIQMPGMNGDEVVRTIRQREGAERHTPIIAVTAHALLGDQERLLEAGCDGYVAKPFFIEVLAAEIRRVMGLN